MLFLDSPTSMPRSSSVGSSFCKAAHQLQSLSSARLPKPKPGSMAVMRSGPIPAASEQFESRPDRKSDTSPHHVEVGRRQLHGGGLALHMHHHDAAIRLAAIPPRSRQACRSRPDVIDDRRADTQALHCMTCGFVGVDGNRHRCIGAGLQGLASGAPVLPRQGQPAAAPGRVDSAPRSSRCRRLRRSAALRAFRAHHRRAAKLTRRRRMNQGSG